MAVIKAAFSGHCVVLHRCVLSCSALAEKKQSHHFDLHLDKLDACVDFVIKLAKKNYPDMNIPYHSRWRHVRERLMIVAIIYALGSVLQFDQKAVDTLV